MSYKKYKANVYNVNMMHHILDIAKDTDMYLPLLLCTTAGLRRGELLALRWEDIDFHKKLLKIRRNMVRGEDDYIIKAPKSEAGIRDICVGDEVIAYLNKEKIRYMTDMMAYGRGFQDLGFVIRQEDGSPIRPDSMSRKWRRFLEANSLPPIRFHDLRHYTVSVMLSLNIPKNYIADFVGHETENMIDKVYGHIMQSRKTSVEDQMQDYFSKFL